MNRGDEQVDFYTDKLVSLAVKGCIIFGQRPLAPALTWRVLYLQPNFCEVTEHAMSALADIKARSGSDTQLSLTMWSQKPCQGGSKLAVASSARVSSVKKECHEDWSLGIFPNGKLLVQVIEERAAVCSESFHLGPWFSH